MNEFLTNLPVTLLRSSVAVAVSASLVALLIRVFNVSSPKLRRLAYLGVIVQGCVFAQASIAVPVLKPDSSVETKFVDHAPAPTRIQDGAEPDGNLATEAGDDLLFNAQPPAVVEPSPTPVANSSFVDRVEWFKLVGIVWLAGIVVLFCRAAWNYGRFLQNLPTPTECDPQWELEWYELQRAAGRHSIVPLAVTATTGPMVCQTLRGYRLFVPAAYWRTLQDDQRMVVLRHELAHLQRRDVWKSLAIRVLALPQWFNPTAWWIVHKFDECAEWACDEFACSASPRHVPGYARALLQLSAGSRSQLMSTTAASSRGMSTRIRRLISSHPWKDSKMKQFTVIAVIAVVSLLNVVRVELSAEDAALAPKAGDATSPPSSGGAVTPGASTDEADTTKADVKSAAAESATDSQPAGEKGAAASEAVVDLAMIFREFNAFNRERDVLKADIEKSDQWAKRTFAEIKELKRELAQFEVNDANRSQFQELEKTLAAKQLTFDDQRKAYQKQFLQHETEIYQKIYNQVTAEVAAYAKEHGIRVVRRRKQNDEKVSKTDSTEAKADRAPAAARNDKLATADHRESGGTKAEVAKSDATSPTDIIKQLQRVVLFVDESQSQPVDITAEVIKRLNDKDAAENPPAAAK